MIGRSLRFLLVLALAMPVAGTVREAAAAQPRDPQNYTRLLLPFHTGVTSGAGFWSVSWWFHNEGDSPADVFPLAVGGGHPPPPAPDGPHVFVLANPAIAPHATPHGSYGDAGPTYPSPPFVPVETSGTGVFVYAESARLPQLAIGGSVQFVAGSIAFNTAPTTSLHAVPETAFASGAHNILPIPLLARSRYALRIYALPETANDPRVTVRIYEIQPWTSYENERLIATVAAALVIPDSRVLPCLDPCDLPGGPFAPASLELFDLARRDPSAAFSTLRVEIAPESPQLRWWAVVSATDNVTGAVTLHELRTLAR